MDNKICVYAICKNESQFVDKWLDSMQEADYIVVLDTGSTDDTYEKLLNDCRVTRVEQKEIIPWRFDTARNESLKLVPDDADILICTDLDEVLIQGWAKTLKEQWDSNKYVRGYYKYAWAHNENGDPENVFWYDKIHSPGYLWKYPVHEALYHPDYDDEYEKNHHICFDDSVFLHHYPDLSKSRKNYLELLETRVKEYPNDFYGKFYLAREYSFYERYTESINEFLDILNMSEEIMNDNLVISGCYCFIGDNYRKMGDNDQAIYFYMLSIKQDKTYREPYLYIAEILNEMKLYSCAIEIVNLCFKNTYRHYNWLERGNTWREKPYDILGISFYYLGEMETSKYYMQKALEYNPTDERLLCNLSFIK